MGEVWLARQDGPAGFRRLVVVKRLLPRFACEAHVQMFLHEAQVMAVLDHPNVVRIIELGRQGGEYFMVLELVQGASFRSMIKLSAAAGARLPFVVSAEIMSQALKGLHYVHCARSPQGVPLGIVHRDVAPDNIMVGFNGVVKLIDFGIAKDLLAPELTRTNMLKGKPGYLSPEHIRGEHLDARADVFAAGVTLYEALAGVRPFRGLPDALILHHLLHSEPPPLPDEVPEVLRELVRRAMAKDPAERFADAATFALALDEWSHAVRQLDAAPSIAEQLALLLGAEGVLPRAVPEPSLVSSESVVSLAEEPRPASSSPAPVAARSASPRRVLAVAAAACLALGGSFALRRPAQAQAATTPPPPAPAPAELCEPATCEAIDSPVPSAPTATADTGKLDIRVIPWGEIYEGDRHLGLTPLAPLTLSPGAHQLTVRNGELDAGSAVRVVVQAGETTRVKVDLFE